MKKPGKEFSHRAFIDSHLHFLGLGQAAFILDLSTAASVEEILTLLAEHKDLPMIVGRGWNQENFIDGIMLSKNDLNKISGSVPIILYRICGHVAVVNDKTLAMIKMDKQIEGGSINFQTGILTENALELLRDIKVIPAKEDIRKYLIKANDLLLSQGITKVLSDDFVVFPISYEVIIDIINELYNEDLLQVKIIEQVHLSKIELLEDFISKGYVNRNFGKWRLGPLKLLADGSLGARTAALNEPYSDDPLNQGIKTFSDRDLLALFNLANANDMDCHIHAIGDAAIEQVLFLMEQSLRQTNRSNHRHAIIHAQLATRKQIERMSKMKIAAIVQPIFLESDIAMVDSRLKNRQNEAYLFHTMLKENVLVGFSTDSPVESCSPFRNIYAAMTRKSVRYASFGAYLPNEAFTLDECLRCYQENNLYLAYEEEKPFNDLVILDRDLHNSCPDDILKTRVLKTIIDGFVVYDFSKGKRRD